VRRLPLTLFSILVLPTVACSGGGKGGSAQKDTARSSTTGPPATPSSLTVKAREYGFDVPGEVEGGVLRMTLQNDGKLKHEAVIVAAGDTPLPQLKHDLTPVVKGEDKPIAPYLHFQGGVSLVAAGTSAVATLTLPAGKYVLVCTLTDADSLDATAGPPPQSAQRFHYDLGMAAPFTVKSTNAAVMPPVDGTVVARDWAFDVPPLTAGTRTFTFRNDGREDHSLAVAEFPDGVDAGAAKAAFDQFLAADAARRPPPENLPVPDDVAFAGPLSAGGQATFTVELKPNRAYVFACYMTDRAGGPRHATGKGMVTYATTSAG
jgi:uncharacterized cupredoxin-like copper-binding protein